MASVLHVLGARDPARALPIIAGQLAAGDTVTIVLVGPATPALPAGVHVRRVPAELSYDQLLDLVFSADQVVTW